MKPQQALAPALIGAIGVVFGDIGTSPLYAFKESLAAAGFHAGDTSTVLGLLSFNNASEPPNPGRDALSRWACSAPRCSIATR